MSEDKRKSIRVGIAGVGDCASSLVQAIAAARAGRLAAGSPGLISTAIAGYAAADLELACAFDVDRLKVGRELAEAIFAASNSASHLVEVPASGITVAPGVLDDGLEGPLGEIIEVHEDVPGVTVEDIGERLLAEGVDVLICLLPTGARRDVRIYATAAARAGVAFVNGTPEPVARDPELAELFRTRRTPVLGDDFRSQIGATALHTALLELCAYRGVPARRSYQLNVGGNHDFLNLADPRRSAAKWQSKHRALEAADESRASSIFAGPVAHVPFLGDHKIAHIRLDGELLLGAAFSIELRLEVEDSPNAAGIALEALRIASAARVRGLGGPIVEPAAFLFKSPPRAMSEREARAAYVEYLERE